MSISALAPTEKSENLIYTIFPISFMSFLVSFFSLDPTTWIALVVVFTPLMVIVFYELGLDETRIRNHHNNELSKLTDRNDFYLCNFYLRTWETTLRTKDQQSEIDGFLDSEFQSYVTSSSSSHFARRRFWRQRASIYIIWSTIFIIGLIVRSLDIFLGNIGKGFFASILPFDSATIWIGFLFLMWFIFSLIVVHTLRRIKKGREIEIEDFLKKYITFLYWQTKIATNAIARPDDYRPTLAKGILKSELESLDLLLVRGDWQLFMARWESIKESINDIVVADFKRTFESNAYKLWGAGNFEERNESRPIRAKQQLMWFIAYSQKSKEYLEGTALALLDYLHTKLSSNEPLLPDEMLERLPERLTDESGPLKHQVSVISGGLSMILVNSTGPIKKVVDQFISELRVSKNSGFTDSRMAEIVVRLIKQTYTPSRESILQGISADHLLSIYSPVQEDDDRVFLLLDWFRKATPKNMVIALDGKGYLNNWKSVLRDTDLEELLMKRVKGFMGDYGREEEEVVKMLLSIYPERKSELDIKLEFFRKRRK